MNSLAEPNKWEKVLWPLLASALLLAVWHYSVVWTQTKVFPGPLQVEKGMVELFHKNVLWQDIGSSLGRVAIGFGAAALLGIPLGLSLGWYPAANQVVNPVMQILRPISPIAWIPVAIISAATTTSQAMPSARRRPTMICGRAAGNTTLANTCAGASPKLRPARRKTDGTFETPLTHATTIGKNAPRKIKNTAA